MVYACNNTTHISSENLGAAFVHRHLKPFGFFLHHHILQNNTHVVYFQTFLFHLCTLYFFDCYPPWASLLRCRPFLPSYSFVSLAVDCVHSLSQLPFFSSVAPSATPTSLYSKHCKQHYFNRMLCPYISYDTIHTA